MPFGISAEFVTGLLSFLFTVLILSYLLGDNPLFRTAVYIFVGVSAGYAAAVAWHQVLLPKLFLPLLQGWAANILLVIPLLLAVLLLAKISPGLARLGNPSMAFLVGVGAAVAVGGAVMGTLFPQTQATFDLPSLFALSEPGNLAKLAKGLVMILGTVATLVYFHFGAKSTPAGPQRSRLVNILSLIGQVFIAITFGMLFAGVYAAAMTALIERLHFLWTFILSLL